MKITIEHELFSATTESLVVAERLIETIHILESKPQTDKKKIIVQKQDIFDTKNTNDVPPELLKKTAQMPKFNPDWIERPIDLSKQRIVRYSNPCSTLHGHNGSKVYQTELMIETDGNLSTCDCEFADLDNLHKTLSAYTLTIPPKTEPKLACSTKRLQEAADLFNRGCNNKQVAEILGLSNLTASKYKSDCRKAGLLK